MLPAKVSRDSTDPSHGNGTAPKHEKANANNAGGVTEGSSSAAFKSEELEAQGIPYMCLAQCSGVETMVGHKKVPPMKVQLY